MPFRVEDFQDLLRLLGEHPEWRAELRRYVLTEELLALPALGRQLAEAQVRTETRLETLAARTEQLAAAQERTQEQLTALAARMEELTAVQVRTEARLEALAARVDQLAEQLAALIARVDQLTEQLTMLTARVDALTVWMDQLAQAQARTEARLDALVTEVGTLKGKMLEIDHRERAPAYFARIARRLRVLDTAAVADLLETAVEEGTLTEQEQDAVLAADLVLTGQRRTDGAAIYIVVEVSAGVGPPDVERAAERARLLERPGRPVVAAVAGSAIMAEAVARAAERKVWQVLDGQTITPHGLHACQLPRPRTG